MIFIHHTIIIKCKRNFEITIQLVLVHFCFSSIFLNREDEEEFQLTINTSFFFVIILTNKKKIFSIIYSCIIINLVKILWY